MHLKRWITSIIGFPLLILIIYKGGALLFAITVSIICILALREYLYIVLNKVQSSENLAQGYSGVSYKLLAFIIAPLIIFAAYNNSFKMILGLVVLHLFFSGLISLQRFNPDLSVSEVVTKQVLGIVYIPLFFSYLVLIRNGNDGIIWIIIILCIIFTGDVVAFYVGSYLGRHKLCPAVSPGKTIEGSIGGLAANLSAGALLKYFFLPLLPWGASILFFLLIGVAGQVGDLFESELKRFGNVKDSGVILPGHGGMLDRIDALLFAAPVAYYFKEYIF